VIKISKPRIVHEPGYTRLESEVDVDLLKRHLFFRVAEPYGSFLCPERSDAFLVALLFHAMEHGHDIRIDGTLDAQLFYQIESTLLDFLISIYPERGLHRCRITATLDGGQLPNENASGTGISCGIDSLAAVARQGEAKFGPMRLTHLCFFNTGSHGETGSPAELQLFEDRRERSRDFCTAAGYPFVEVVSNLSELVDPNFGLTHTYRNISAVLALQKLFASYYYASAYTAPSFLEHTDDPAYFEILLLPLLSTRNTRFYSAETTVGRFDKTRLVADYPLSRNFLNVCNVQNINCGKCNKCLRTLLALDALGKLDDFTAVFDIPSYRANRSRHLAYHFERYLEGEHSHLELHPHIKGQLGFREILGGSLARGIAIGKDQLRRHKPLHAFLRRLLKSSRT
jgi:hypothetical protein